jgi:hypothetical protein
MPFIFIYIVSKSKFSDYVIYIRILYISKLTARFVADVKKDNIINKLLFILMASLNGIL